MLFSRHLLIVGMAAVVSLPARSAVVPAPYRAAGGSGCTHPLFVNPYPVGTEPYSVAVGDLDGINGPDLAVANYSSDDVSVLLNRGNGSFVPAVAYAAGDGAHAVAIGDLDAWEAMVEWLETLEDVEVAKHAYAQLNAAGGERERAGWLKWDEVRENLS